MLKDEIIYTKRLNEVPMNMEHAKYFLEYYDDDAAFYMDLIPSGDKEESVEKFIKQSMEELEQETDLHLIMFNKENNDFIGYIGIYYLKEDKPEIGVWVSKNNQHKGYATEAITSAIKWLRENVKFSYIRCPIDRENKHSRDITKYCNAILHKEYKTISCTGRELDIVEYWIKYEDAINIMLD